MGFLAVICLAFHPVLGVEQQPAWTCNLLGDLFDFSFQPWGLNIYLRGYEFSWGDLVDFSFQSWG